MDITLRCTECGDILYTDRRNDHYVVETCQCLTDKINDLEDGKSEMERGIDDLKDEISDLEHQISTLQSTILDQQKDLEYKDMEIDGFKEANEKLEEELLNLKSEIKKKLESIVI